MTALTTKLYNDLYNYGGANETAKLHCYTDAAHTTLDNTHLSGAGAQKLASMIAEQTISRRISARHLRGQAKTLRTARAALRSGRRMCSGMRISSTLTAEWLTAISAQRFPADGTKVSFESVSHPGMYLTCTASGAVTLTNGSDAAVCTFAVAS